MQQGVRRAWCALSCVAVCVPPVHHVPLCQRVAAAGGCGAVAAPNMHHLACARRAAGTRAVLCVCAGLKPWLAGGAGGGGRHRAAPPPLHTCPCMLPEMGSETYSCVPYTCVCHAAVHPPGRRSGRGSRRCVARALAPAAWPATCMGRRCLWPPASGHPRGGAGPPCCDAGWVLHCASLYPVPFLARVVCALHGRVPLYARRAGPGQAENFGPLLHFALREACPLVYGRWFVGGVCAVSRTGCGDGCGGVCWVFCMCGRGMCVRVGRCLLTAQVGLAPSLGCMVGVVEAAECVSKGRE